MPGAIIRDPTPEWMKAKNASVFDSPTKRVGRWAAHLLGLDDPQSQVLALMGPMETGPVGGIEGAVRKFLGHSPAPAATDLDMSHAARMQRATEQGFTTDAYRGAKVYNEPIQIPAWFAGVDDANVYSGSVNPTARLFGAENVPTPPALRGSQVQPVKLRIQNPKKVSFTEIAYPTPESLARAKAEGYDALMRESPNGEPWYVPLDLAQIRSRFAAFDPRNLGKAGLLGSLVGGIAVGGSPDAEQVATPPPAPAPRR